MDSISEEHWEQLASSIDRIGGEIAENIVNVFLSSGPAFPGGTCANIADSMLIHAENLTATGRNLCEVIHLVAISGKQQAESISDVAAAINNLAEAIRDHGPR